MAIERSGSKMGQPIGNKSKESPLPPPADPPRIQIIVEPARPPTDNVGRGPPVRGGEGLQMDSCAVTYSLSFPLLSCSHASKLLGDSSSHIRLGLSLTLFPPPLLFPSRPCQA